MAKTNTTDEETFGTFTKGDMERTAYSTGEAVSLRFTGWSEKAAKAAAEPPAKPADKS